MTVQYYKRYRMELDLRRVHFGELSLPDGYRFVAWSPGLEEVHAEVKYRSFRWELDSSVFPCLGDEMGCQQLMSDIARRDGFLPAASWLVTHHVDPAIPHEYCGTIQGVMTDTFTGGIQNVGVTPDHRGQGLGAALVTRAVAGFQRSGADRVHLEVTAKNVDAIRLYHRLGFRTVKTVYKAVEIAYT